MKRYASMLLTGGLAAGLAGCAEEPAAAPTASFAPAAKPAETAAPAKSAEGVLVSVKMPNMT